MPGQMIPVAEIRKGDIIQVVFHEAEAGTARMVEIETKYAGLDAVKFFDPVPAQVVLVFRTSHVLPRDPGVYRSSDSTLWVGESSYAHPDLNGELVFVRYDGVTVSGDSAQAFAPFERLYAIGEAVEVIGPWVESEADCEFPYDAIREAIESGDLS